MNFFFIFISAIALLPNPSPGSYSAREIFEKCRDRTAQIDSAMSLANFQFVQKLEMISRTGDKDDLIFRIIARHGRFERKLLSTTVPNGDRYNAGYDAFDKMFFLSGYFSDPGKTLSTCELEKPEGNGYYRIRFTYSNSTGGDDPLSTVSATLNSTDYTPIRIEEMIKGLPLDVEFDNDISVGFDSALGMSYPQNVVMHVYAKFFFLKGEIAVVKIRNEDLRGL